MGTNRIITKEYVICMIANFLCSVNFIGLMTTVAPYAMGRFGSSESAAGFAVSLIVVGALLARLFAGRYALAIGYRRMLTIGLAAISLSTLAYLAADSYFLFCLIRFANGLAFGISANTTITIITSIIPKNRSGEGVGYFSMSQIVGTAIGPYIAIRMLHGSGFDSVFLLAAIAPAIALPLMFFLNIPKPDETGPLPEESLSTFDKLFERKVFPIAALCFLVYLGVSAIISFIAVYASEQNLQGSVSYYFPLYAAALIATRPFVSKLFDRRGPNIILYPGFVLFAAALLLLAMSKTASMLLVSGMMYGVGLGAIQAGTLAIVVGLVPRHRLAVANGTYYMSLDSSSSLGPVIAGLLIKPAGFHGMFLIMAVLAACALPLYYLLYARKNR